MKLERVDRSVWRGSTPRMTADFYALKNLGIELVIDLQSILSFKSQWRQIACAERDMSTLWLRCGILLPPSEHKVQTVFSIMDHKKVFIHCRNGVDRTGLVIAQYRMAKCGWSRGEAFHELKEKGFHKIYLPWLALKGL